MFWLRRISFDNPDRSTLALDIADAIEANTPDNRAHFHVNGFIGIRGQLDVAILD
jgi:hypothetical protein